jgi:hypothetical protein
MGMVVKRVDMMGPLMLRLLVDFVIREQVYSFAGVNLELVSPFRGGFSYAVFMQIV